MKHVSIPQQVVNQKITKIWRGYAGVIFLELGKLHKKLMKSSKSNYFYQKGEFTIMIEGNWLLKKDNEEILTVVQSSYKEIDDVLKNLVGLQLKSAEFNKSSENFIFQISENYFLQMDGSKNQRLTIFNKDKTLFGFGE